MELNPTSLARWVKFTPSGYLPVGYALKGIAVKLEREASLEAVLSVNGIAGTIFSMKNKGMQFLAILQRKAERIIKIWRITR